MKKILSLIIVLATVLGCFTGCNTAPAETTAAAKEPILKVGYSRVDISPTESVPMSGYGNDDSRWSTEVADPLYATCVAFSDDTGATVLLFHMDLGGSATEASLKVRVAVANETGVPKENIFTAATHTHSAPSIGLTTNAAIKRYVEMIIDLMVQAAKEAVADLKVAKMYTASTYPVGLNFNRHYILADGTKVGHETGSRGKDIYGHVIEPDNELQMIKFVRDGGKDVVLVNWQSHPHRGGGSKKTYITSDLVGYMRSTVEEAWDCQFAYFTGASGNVNPYSLISSENITKDYKEQGKALGQYAIDAADQFKEVKTGNIGILKETYMATYLTGGQWKGEIPIFAFSIGDVAFVTAPYEMFSENGQTIKDGSPYETTFVVTCCNDRRLYIPAADAYTYDTYEVTVTQYAAGTAEELAETYVSMLKKLHAGNE